MNNSVANVIILIITAKIPIFVTLIFNRILNDNYGLLYLLVNYLV